jgi:hypothetical protein
MRLPKWLRRKRRTIKLHKPDPNLYFALHTTWNPYTGGRKIAVAGVPRNVEEWRMDGHEAYNVNDIVFEPVDTGGLASFLVVKTGSGETLFDGVLEHTVAIDESIQPVIPAGKLRISEESVITQVTPKPLWSGHDLRKTLWERDA